MYGSTRRRTSGTALRRYSVGALLLGLLAGCAARTTGAAALPDREFVGHLFTRDGGNWFRPCGADPGSAPLWVTFTGVSVGQIESVRSAAAAVSGDTTFVRWRAALTDERMVGPGGPALLVRDIVESRPAEAGDCADRAAPASVRYRGGASRGTAYVREFAPRPGSSRSS